MPSHRTPAIHLLPALLAGGACAGIASAQVTSEFTNSGQALGNNNTETVVLGDLDGDDDLDALIVNSLEDNTVWINDGNGTFTNRGAETPVPLMATGSAALGDLDGDGDLDVMFANASGSGSANYVWFNNGDATFSHPFPWQELGQSMSMALALGDLDGDGDLDAMVGNFNQPNRVWTNDGNGTFTNSGQALGNGKTRSVALGDLDGDGDLDALVANITQPFAVWTNDGNGTFTNSHNFGSGGTNATSAVALGDFDADGDLDAMATASYQPTTVWTNDGTGIFTNSGPTLGRGDSTALALGDFDGDGAIDAMVVNFENAKGDGAPNTVWTNDGNGTFTDSGQTLGNTNSISVALGDLDGDGAVDAMVANRDQPSTVWTNTVTGTGVCCAPSGCTLMTENLSGVCERLGGTFIPQGSCDDCPTSCPADLNHDGVVDGFDLTVVLGAWGLPCDG